jgi:hypothetical protein
MKMSRKAAIAAIDRAGALLVFPLDNRKEPASLWSHFFPRTPMRWEWDEDGDDRVSSLWALRGDLSTARSVIYTKWFRGRATYFSRELFACLLRGLNPEDPREGLVSEARRILSVLEGESPLSPKELKRIVGLQGRASERVYEKALRELWSRLLVVAYGEIEDSSFPSLAVGATRAIYEDLWTEAWRMEPARAEARIRELLASGNLFLRHYEKLRNSVPAARTSARRNRHAVGAVVRFEDLA